MWVVCGWVGGTGDEIWNTVAFWDHYLMTFHSSFLRWHRPWRKEKGGGGHVCLSPHGTCITAAAHPPRWSRELPSHSPSHDCTCCTCKWVRLASARSERHHVTCWVGGAQSAPKLCRAQISVSWLVAKDCAQKGIRTTWLLHNKEFVSLVWPSLPASLASHTLPLSAKGVACETSLPGYSTTSALATSDHIALVIPGQCPGKLM